jgi:hypothetical protein
MKVLLKSALPVLFFPFLLLNPQQSKAEGGCPKGLFPAGGGYCRNIVCVDTGQNYDRDTQAIMKKYNLRCSGFVEMSGIFCLEERTLGGITLPVMKECPPGTPVTNNTYGGGRWGNLMVPMR